jgi:hypothetical protein
VGKTSKKSRKPMIACVRKSEVINYVGRFWQEIEYRSDGELKIEQFSGVTKHEAESKATKFVNALMEGK